jgi:hypothetical protein
MEPQTFISTVRGGGKSTAAAVSRIKLPSPPPPRRQQQQQHHPPAFLEYSKPFSKQSPWHDLTSGSGKGDEYRMDCASSLRFQLKTTTCNEPLIVETCLLLYSNRQTEQEGYFIGSLSGHLHGKGLIQSLHRSKSCNIFVLSAQYKKWVPQFQPQ